MPQRITKKDLEMKVKYFNDSIAHNNIYIEIGHRYNYTAIDLYTKDGRMHSTIITGLTAGQAWNYINAMQKGIELATGSYRGSIF